jgi:hypothetical protein
LIKRCSTSVGRNPWYARKRNKSYSAQSINLKDIKGSYETGDGSYVSGSRCLFLSCPLPTQ